MMLGQVLVRTLSVAEDAVDRAVEAQREGDVRDIGTILCDDEGLDGEDLATALELQRRLRGDDVPGALVEMVRLAYARARAAFSEVVHDDVG